MSRLGHPVRMSNEPASALGVCARRVLCGVRHLYCDCRANRKRVGMGVATGSNRTYDLDDRERSPHAADPDTCVDGVSGVRPFDAVRSRRIV